MYRQRESAGLRVRLARTSPAERTRVGSGSRAGRAPSCRSPRTMNRASTCGPLPPGGRAASVYEGKNALAWARASARSVCLSFLDEQINVEGRANVVQLLVDAGAK